MSSTDALAQVLARWPEGIDVIPSGGLDRHSFTTRRAVAIAAGGVDRAVLERHYPPDVLDAAIGAPLGEFVVLPPRDAYGDLASVGALARIAERLRLPGGCPWDREQTHESLRPLLLEEAHEVVAALDSADPAALRDELGDLLFHVVIHAQIASEAGTFDLAAVARAAGEKLVRRHPHVFEGAEIEGGDVLGQWERIKRDERAAAGRPEASVLDGLPKDLPSLYAAERMLERAGRIGLEHDRIDLPIDVDDAEALGALLFDLAALAREQGIDAETALRQANARFAARVRRLEERTRADGRELGSYSRDELRELWAASA